VTTRVNLLVSLPVGTRLGAGDPRTIVELARRVEDAGADGIVLADHVLLGKRLDRYPWGKFPFPSDAPWLEPLTMLTAIAVATDRLKLTTGILIVPLRPATLLAKTVATLDVLSGGRVELGVGTGWQEEELDAQGVEYAARGQVLTDYIAACRELWKGGPASFESASVRFTDVWSHPTPIRVGGPPILFSGTLTPRNIRRIVELGDGWIPIMGATADDIETGIGELRSRLAAAGRASDALLVRAPLPIVRGSDDGPSLGASLDAADELAAIGVTDVNMHLPAFVRDEDAVESFFAELARSWGGR
jgi:probable F420-dependent oxidoreductase